MPLKMDPLLYPKLINSISAVPGEKECIPKGNFSPFEPKEGLVIQGYRLVYEIGRGGMGTVWKCTQIATGLSFAIKMVLDKKEEPPDLVRFMTESVTMASIHHPNVVRVHEFGNEQGCPFLVMEFMPGGSLGEKIRSDQRLDQMKAAKLLGDICKGVQAAHDLGIVHRDLKSDNILFDDNQNPKVIDFGLAKQPEGLSKTVSHAVLGTPLYMSPEQAEGKSRFVGPSADIYALGVILYECLTGTLPFQGENPLQILRMISQSNPESPRRRVPLLHRDIERICLKCLGKDPAERYLSCRDLAEDLERFIKGQPLRAHYTSSFSRLWYWAKRNKPLAATIGSAVLFLFVAAFGFAGLSIWALSERNNSRISENNAVQSEERAVRQQNVAESHLYISNIQRALTEWTNGRPQTARERLEQSPFERRGWEHNYVHTMVESNQVVLAGHTAEVQGVAYSPDGKWIASASDDRTIKIWDAHQGILVKTFDDHHDFVRGVCFSKDGSILATASANGLIKIRRPNSWETIQTINVDLEEVDGLYFGKCFAISPDGKTVSMATLKKGFAVFWDTETGKIKKKLKHDLAFSNQITFSNKGNLFLSAMHSNMVSLWNINDGNLVRNFKKESNDAEKAVCFSEDGEKIASGGDDKKVRIWNAKSGKLIHVLTGHKDTVTAVAFSPNGKWIASGSDDHTIRIWDVDSGNFVRLLKGHGHVIRGICFSPDGGKLVSGSWDGTVRVWNYLSDQSNKTVQLDSKRTRDVSFSPDGKYIVAAKDDGSILVLSDKKEYLTKPIGKSKRVHFFGVCFSPNGEQVLGAGSDSSIYIWDFPGRKLSRVLEGHQSNVQSLCYTPDGQKVVSGSDDHLVKIWDAKDLRLLKTLDNHKLNVLSVSVSPNGKWIASASADKTIKIWDAEDFTLKWDLLASSGSVRCVAFSPDSKRLVSGDADKNIRIWDVDSGNPIWTLRGHIDGITRVSFSPDGKRILSCSFDNSLKLWDAETGSEILTLAEHTSSVRSAKFSPDGKTIASVGDDGLLIIWNGSDKGERMVFNEQEGHLRRVGFTPDESYIINYDENKIINKWEIKNGNQVDIVEDDNFNKLEMEIHCLSRDGRWMVEKELRDLFLVDNEARNARKARDKQRLINWQSKVGN